jgi:hypothetical protein
MNLSGIPTEDLVNELERRVDPEKPEWEPGNVIIHAMLHGEEGVIVKYVPYGLQGLDKKPETVQYGIYNARIIVVQDEERGWPK